MFILCIIFVLFFFYNQFLHYDMKYCIIKKRIVGDSNFFHFYFIFIIVDSFVIKKLHLLQYIINETHYLLV